MFDVLRVRESLRHKLPSFYLFGNETRKRIVILCTLSVRWFGGDSRSISDTSGSFEFCISQQWLVGHLSFTHDTKVRSTQRSESLSIDIAADFIKGKKVNMFASSARDLARGLHTNASCPSVISPKASTSLYQICAARSEADISRHDSVRALFSV
ncbi:hypothetical protein EJ08DRAFT_379795 [Tothia fuscella]|uniref:Uncharacterized protein n=1 Tax=Tothia fuscella TaxID=1048955 RepID=A0A9P4TVH7_9PEZI|nr:hypothetical protein EJ08DRAFT_379795 [Tothia fuscella]